MGLKTKIYHATGEHRTWSLTSLADLGGAQGAPDIFSISCSFFEKLANLYVGAPVPSPDGWRQLLWEIPDPPLDMKLRPLAVVLFC